MARLPQLPESFTNNPRIQQLDRELITRARVFDHVPCTHDGERYKVYVALDHDGTYFASIEAVERVFWAGHYQRPSEALYALLEKLRYGVRRWYVHHRYHVGLKEKRAMRAAERRLERIETARADLAPGQPIPYDIGTEQEFEEVQ